jgi:hypothetical protein
MTLALCFILLTSSWQNEFFPGVQYLPAPEKEDVMAPIPPAAPRTPEPVLYA